MQLTLRVQQTLVLLKLQECWVKCSLKSWLAVRGQGSRRLYKSR